MPDLGDILTSAEAAHLWRLNRDTVKRACRENRLIHGVECRKSNGTWLVTRKGMERLYGDQKTNSR